MTESIQSFVFGMDEKVKVHSRTMKKDQKNYEKDAKKKERFDWKHLWREKNLSGDNERHATTATTMEKKTKTITHRIQIKSNINEGRMANNNKKQKKTKEKDPCNKYCIYAFISFVWPRCISKEKQSYRQHSHYLTFLLSLFLWTKDFLVFVSFRPIFEIYFKTINVRTKRTH